MKAKDLSALAQMNNDPGPWGDVVPGSKKGEFKRIALAWLRGLVSDLPKDGVKIKFNAGGVAVSGEATLEIVGLYLHISSNGMGLLYRLGPDAIKAGNRWLPASIFLSEPTPMLRQSLFKL